MTDTIRLDLHVHTRFSPDGRIDLDRLVDALGVAGMQGAAVTDHNTVAGHARLRALAKEFPMYRFLPGEEVSTVEGHLLVYGADAPAPTRRPLAETLDWVRAQGAVAVLAHPFRFFHGVGRRIAETAPVAGIETANGHSGVIANARAELVAARRTIGMTGGSDAHDARDVGRAFTEFPADASSVDDLLAALARGRTRGSGRSLTLAQRVRLGVRTGLKRAARGFRSI
ncbi:MAG TPA: CehA/McbA family metallohydrolase [Thermoplasmata archaeon]|nr:CehA/McbA family metallohydrolase [Thermoplasmata archaeon]HUJ78308.1 CehA/McbA family metallohydrolase [Thermoplasmata archaeon]